MPAHDVQQRRRATRSGRERGCWVYVPAEELVKAGHAPGGPAPFYRTWGSKKGSVLVQLYHSA